MPGIRSTRLRAAVAALLALLSALALSACGSSKPAGTAADPATVVPASVPLYVGAVVRPEGDLQRYASADASTITHSKHPYSSLLKALQGTKLLGHFDYEREVKPWLGSNAGLFSTSPAALSHIGEALGQSLGKGASAESLLSAGVAGIASAKGLQGALVLDTTDVEKARSFLEKIAKRAGAHRTSYKGVSYEVDSEGIAEGIVGRFAVIGTESALRGAIEAHAGGPSLAKGSPAYGKLASKAVPGTLVSVYIDTASGSSPQQEGGSSAGAGSLLSLLPGEPQQLRISLVPGKDRIELDADMLSSSSQAESKAASSTAAAAHLLEELPSGSWLAASVGESGTHAARYLAAMRSVVSLAASTVLSSFGGPAFEGLVDKLAARSGAVQRIFSGWAGPAAVFASGAGLLNLQAGLVIESSSPERARSAVEMLGAALASTGATVQPRPLPEVESALEVKVSRLPVTLYLGSGGGRFAFGIGPASVQSALQSEGGLSESPLYTAAKSSLGGGTKPVAIFSVPSLLGFLEGLGLNENPSVAPTLSYLRPLGTLAAGSQSLGGGITRLHAVLGLQRGGGEGEG